MGNDHLTDRFADAGLRLQRAPGPITRGPGVEAIFQMDIRRARRWDPHSEYYLTWPGAADNVAVVQGVDRAAHQLVLMVREPKRYFYEPVPRHAFKRWTHLPNWREQLARTARIDVNDIIKEGEAAWIRRVADERKRHFLVGRDERQLFMCRLPRACSTVRQAHEVLRPPGTIVRRSALETTLRQGEWFFVPIEAEERAAMVHETWYGRARHRRRASINSAIPRPGKPHIADEIVRVRQGDRGFRAGDFHEARSLAGGLEAEDAVR